MTDVAAATSRPQDTRPNPVWMSLLLTTSLVIGLIAVAVVAWSHSFEVPTGPQGTKSFTGLSHKHVLPGVDVDYSVTPPVGGKHYYDWQNCGIYSAPREDRFVVHSMEHGAVWVTYRQNMPADQVERLRGIVRNAYHGDERYIVLSPYSGLQDEVVASAWGRQLRLEDVADPRLLDFLATFAGGPQSLESFYPCATQGVGKPLDE